MDLLARDCIFSLSSLSLEEDIMINKIMFTHDPDGRHLDAEILLHAVENIICYATATQVPVFDLHFDANGKNNLCNIEVVGLHEPLGNILYRISCELIHCKHFGEGELQTRTMILFDLLGSYRWDVKVVLVLAAFAITYGEFWLLMQLYPCNHLAALVAILSHLPRDLSAFKPQLKALGLLVKAMVDVTKCIIKFEGLPLQHVELDREEVAITKSQIYVATYWVVKSALTCSSQVTDLKATKHEHSNSITIAAWELSSFVYRLSTICSRLRQQVEVCYQQIESKIYQKLLYLPKETHVDNQEVLSMLFTLNDDFPLKGDSSQSKLSVSELRNKIVLLLVSKPELIPTETLFLLVQQICDHPHNKKLKESYEIVWVPISQSDMWVESEEESFDFLSNSLPFYSIRKPWSLSKVVVQYIKQVWTFKDEPLLVVLDSQGVVTNSNAFDMVLIWGARAYPFSASRENELWEEEKWSIQLILYQIDPRMTKWVEEGRNLCIYGGDNLDWIREFTAKMKEITSAGVQLEIVYVGNYYNSSEQAKNIFATIDQEKLSAALSYSKLQLFWHRLESMRRSKLRTGKKAGETDHILEEVAGLLDFDDNEKGWAVFGTGSSIDIIKLQGSELIQCLDNFSVWAENVALLGFFGALSAALKPPHENVGPCNHSSIIPYVEGLIEKTMVCDKCKLPMEKFIVYQ